MTLTDTAEHRAGGFTAVIARLRDAPDGAAELLTMLREHAGPPGSREADRRRGAVLAAFADTGLPNAALPYVVEALEAGEVPEEVAGAAMALRGRTLPPPRIAASLQRALDNQAGVDGPVVIAGRPATTVHTELLRVLDRFAAHDPISSEILDELAQEAAAVAFRSAVGAAAGGLPRPRPGT